MLQQFDINNIPQLVERLFPLWKVDGAEDSFNKLYVEMIIRTNMHENKMQFQLTEENQLCAIAFAAVKNDINDSTWLDFQLEKLNETERNSFMTGQKYLQMMEERTFAYMTENDIKLCLFVSIKKGYGKKILTEAADCFKKLGYRNIYLWTDGECNVQWYFDNGYELLQEDIYEPFSTEDFKYKTYIFRKKIS